MSRIKKDLTETDVDVSVELLPQALSGKKTAIVKVSFGPLEAEETRGGLDYEEVHEFQEDEQYPQVLAEAIESLNAEVEILLDELAAKGVIE